VRGRFGEGEEGERAGRRRVSARRTKGEGEVARGGEGARGSGGRRGREVGRRLEVGDGPDR
jgi:hypothetical protein